MGLSCKPLKSPQGAESRQILPPRGSQTREAHRGQNCNQGPLAKLGILASALIEAGHYSLFGVGYVKFGI
jgi:hypothetical protein